jgi:hypothetical protein
METVISIVIGSIFGFLGSLAISWWFYRKSSEDLRREAEELRNASNTTLKVLQALSGGYKFEIRWKGDRPVGVDYQVDNKTDQLGMIDSVDINLKSGTEDKDS